jgi:uncharacterized DUF497 family protein
MEFDWDTHNRDKNKIKHEVEYFEAEELFFNSPLFVLQDMSHSQKEDRYVVYGRTDGGRLLTVIYTIRNTKIRIISARDQNKKEKAFYQLQSTLNEQTKSTT